jgi:transposase
MTENAPSINQTLCKIYEIEYQLATVDCDRCGQPTPRFSTAHRTAIDLNLDQPSLLHITVSVHHCSPCQHYFRVQPPFLRSDAIYTNRVVNRTVKSVYEDGMAMRRVPTRMGRDFWVQPSEGSVRGWCRTYSAGFDFVTDYQPWVVNEFSGILCVDELYQHQLALLLAVDPAAPDGDRLVGYQLVHGKVGAPQMQEFLLHLKAVGIEPDEVITDGSKLYPTVLAEVWPQAAHQLCLFHETRRITQAVMKEINLIRKRLPQPPPSPGLKPAGPLRPHPPSPDPNDPASQRWYWRQVQRHERIKVVQELAEQGLSYRAIARQTGHDRRTIKKWLHQPMPPLPENVPAHISEMAALPVRQQYRLKKQQLRHQVHTLAQQGRSYSAIAREVGLHRVTVKSWLQQAPPVLEESLGEQPNSIVPPPPAPWTTWDEVRQIREALKEHRFLFVKRPEKITIAEQEQLDLLLNSPIGSELQVPYNFLLDWYQLWHDHHRQRRSLAEAQSRYEVWRTKPAYQALAHLKYVQDQMTPAKFENLSQFLHQPEWEATNNGAERAGRAFRHRQAAHFNLRNKESIEGELNVSAYLRQQAALQPSPEPFHTCQRGRNRKPVLIPT